MNETTTPYESATDSATTGRRPVPWLLIALVGARVAALAYLLLSHQEQVDGGLTGDVRRYIEMSTAQGMPYRDFQVEYPPITFLLIKLLTGADHARSIAAVAVSQFACDLGIAGLVNWAWGRRAGVTYLLLGLPLMAWPFVYARVDLLTVLLAVAGMAMIRKGLVAGEGSDRLVAGGGVGLALAVLAKLWPLALAPVLIVERKTKGLLALMAVGAAGLAAWAGVAGASGFQQVLSFREATGWQVESVPGILWHLRDPSRIKFESGAFRSGVMPAWGRPLLTMVSLLLVTAAWILAARRRANGADESVSFADAPLAAVLSLLLFAPILSPQYVVWMLPFAALVAVRGDRLVGGLALAISVVTTISYVFVLDAADGHLYGTLPVVVRNALLIALLAVAFQRLAGVRTGADEPAARPAPALNP
jgi:hypothetical protein